MAKKKILIVDDEEAFGQMVKLNLEEAGDYEVRVENKGECALTTAREFKPDMIFLDIIMPDVDGAEVAQEINSDQGLKNTPVVFLTAIVREEDKASRKGITIGSYLYPCLTKPVTVAKLIECIKQNTI